jgi:hypothetical protein
MKHKKWIYFFLGILVLTIFATLFSLIQPDFYFRDSSVVATKSYYLDIIMLGIIVPLGIFMFLMTLRGKYWTKVYILGIMAFFAFMYGFNALNVKFNELFLIYIALFSLNVFGLNYGFKDVRNIGDISKILLNLKVSSGILIFFAAAVYITWIIEVVSSTINGTIPESIKNMDLPTNVVHVFDMAFALPLIIIGAVQLLRRKISGLILSTIMSAFVFLICISLLGMELALLSKGMPFDKGKLIYISFFTPLSIFPMIALFKTVSKYSPNQ